jgi:acyl-CoA dehydrogenase
MRIFDRSVLDLPFYDDRHRALAARLEAWVAENRESLAGEPALGDVKDHGRRIARVLGADGWLDYAIRNMHDPTRPGIDFRSFCLVREAFAFLDELVDVSFMIQSLACAALIYYGTDDQKADYLDAFRSGAKIGSLALSEPDVGSDVGGLRLHAAKRQDGYVLNGEKTWLTNGNIADYHCVFARTGEAPGALGLSCFIVPADAPGVSVKEDIDLTAARPFASIVFEDCVVPAANLIGKPGHGFRYAMEILDRYRLTVGAAAVGFCRKAMTAALDWSTTRKVGEATLFDMQMTKQKLADMAVYLDAASLLVARAAWEVDTGVKGFAKHSSIAKLYSTETAQDVIDDAVQIFGAAGLVRGSVTESLYRQIRSLRIYEGTSEIQRMIIAAAVRKSMLG